MRVIPKFYVVFPQRKYLTEAVMDVAKAFTFVMEDEEWLSKLGIGALIVLASFFIIPIPLLVGYQVAVARNVMQGEKRPLPAWDNWGKLYTDGLSLMAALLVYTLPFWIIVCIATFSTIGLGGLSENMSEDALAAGIFATWGLVGCLSLVFGLAWFLLSPAIVIQYLRHDNLAACLRIREVLALVRENLGDIVIAGLASFGATFVLNILVGGLSIIPCLGQIVGVLLWLAATPWLLAMMGHLYGQIGGAEPKTAFDM
jgi:hypothetical protein